MPSGKYFCKTAIFSFTAVAVAKALPLLDSITAIPVVLTPFRRVEEE